MYGFKYSSRTQAQQALRFHLFFYRSYILDGSRDTEAEFSAINLNARFSACCVRERTLNVGQDGTR